MIKLSIPIWLEEGITQEFEVSGDAGQAPYELSFYPYKMFSLDILNKPDSQSNVQVTVNSQSYPRACTLEPGRGRMYDAKSPKYERVTIYFTGPATVRITATR
jgi:hypothetical protein